MIKYIGLESTDKTIEYNARFLLGNKIAETLQLGKVYTLEMFKNMDVEPFFIQTNTQHPASKQLKMQWRCVSI